MAQFMLRYTFMALLLLVGCSRLTMQANRQQVGTTNAGFTDIELPVGRFQPIAATSFLSGVPGGLSLDTATGRLCRTYDWVAIASSELARAGLTNLPLCEDLVFVTPVIVNDSAGKDHRFMSVKSAAEFHQIINAGRNKH
jgi:hypothetical protein